MATEEGRDSLACVGLDSVGRLCRRVRWWRGLEVIRGEPPVKYPTAHRGPEEWICEDCEYVVTHPSRLKDALDALPLTDPYGDNLRALIASRLGPEEMTPSE